MTLSGGETAWEDSSVVGGALGAKGCYTIHYETGDDWPVNVRWTMLVRTSDSSGGSGLLQHSQKRMVVAGERDRVEPGACGAAGCDAVGAAGGGQGRGRGWGRAGGVRAASGGGIHPLYSVTVDLRPSSAPFAMQSDRAHIWVKLTKRLIRWTPEIPMKL